MPDAQLTETQKILKLIEENQLAEAKELCLALLKKDQSVEVLQLAGLIFVKLKDFKKAESYFEKALAKDPGHVEQHINLSNIYFTAGELNKAQQHIQQALRINPQHAEAYNNFGRLRYAQNLFKEAITYLEKALRINPDYWEAHYNLAHSFAQENQFNQAAVHYREVLRLQPRHPTAHFNLGLIYFEEFNYEKALEHLEENLNITGDSSATLYYLAHSYLALGRLEKAISSFERSIHLNKPENLGENHHNLAVLFLRQENFDKALYHFEHALNYQPQNATAKHMILALRGIQTEEIAPKQYIADLFDQYADYYNLHVKEKLNYQVPGLLRNALGRCLGGNTRAGRVLDLGCGTGLCGVYFRDLAVELIGVDLSPKMVRIAQELGAYEEVVVADMNDYLSQPELKPFDLIIAGDVLVYAGNLTDLFKKIAAKLMPKGRFAFTTELTDKADYFLKPSGRFAHSINYIHQLAKSNQLEIELEENIVPREHEGKAIEGRLYVLKAIA